MAGKGIERDPGIRLTSIDAIEKRLNTFYVHSDGTARINCTGNPLTKRAERRLLGQPVITAANGHLRIRRTPQCLAGALDRNRISNGGKNGLTDREGG
ncbi:hypothetical protein EVAR_61754_1 [Eumeta japonica]|uniref:Uncharacterized protein n=1 Tax=Eumeta variegata TaxID=151549 RepID=A0A4C1ZFV4_EUMVA|nr:hypothetical protein EVAR_61754_1 [Eumeta japonica]